MSCLHAQQTEDWPWLRRSGDTSESLREATMRIAATVSHET
jgi:hypothetical protein